MEPVNGKESPPQQEVLTSGQWWLATYSKGSAHVFYVLSILHNSQAGYWWPTVSPPSRFPSPTMQRFFRYIAYNTYGRMHKAATIAKRPSQHCPRRSWRKSKYGAIEPCVWKPHTALTSPRHPLLFLSFLCHPYILTIFLENLYFFLVIR